jgi:GTP cyclohydrolase IA
VTVIFAPQIAFESIPPSQQIVHGPITYVSHCARHGLPFFGRAYVGYVPTSERLAAATLRRMVQQAARHGEGALEAKIGSMLQVCIKPAGVALVTRSSHDCIGPRLLDGEGGRRSTWSGRYRADRSLRTEFLALCDHGAP